ncbi:hypothetical protein O181_006995 [Austropuccinia psidii MF-1]|uniref:Uncharacterized protein n=1 Tax=Austropuccinia psidii MF-1 TaxID=1389203 RepID=A0A9Q3BM26_9BASI|nr:hypothetical protein [Austropuccinia psidii MF-1]
MRESGGLVLTIHTIHAIRLEMTSGIRASKVQNPKSQTWQGCSKRPNADLHAVGALARVIVAPLTQIHLMGSDNSPLAEAQATGQFKLSTRLHANIPERFRSRRHRKQAKDQYLKISSRASANHSFHTALVRACSLTFINQKDFQNGLAAAAVNATVKNMGVIQFAPDLVYEGAVDRNKVASFVAIPDRSQTNVGLQVTADFELSKTARCISTEIPIPGYVCRIIDVLFQYHYVFAPSYRAKNQSEDNDDLY